MIRLTLALAIAVALTAAPSAAPAKPAPAPTPLPTVTATYDHDLATPTGPVRLTWPSIAYDRAHGELFLVADGFVRIFDAGGMEVHRFGDDGSLGQVARVAVLEDGELVVMTKRDGKQTYLRCDFRGEPLAELSLTGLPESLADFHPDQLVHHEGRLYFAERALMRVVVTDVLGVYRQSHLLRDLVAAGPQADGERKGAASLDGFGVDVKGNLLFTMSTKFAVGVVSPAGELRTFGARGSRPGRFNNVGGIASDEQGNLYVTDRLRSVVSVWDRELRHLADFGYRGADDSNLVAPYEIAAGNGKVFVAQAADRGVRVFRLQIGVPEPKPPAPPPPLPEPPLRGPRRLG